VTNPRHQTAFQRVAQPVKRDDDVQPPGYDGEQGAAIVEVVKMTGGDDDRTGRRKMLQALHTQLDAAHRQATDCPHRCPGELMGH
jgi:hypothetical protein